jgi:uncharacterized phage protein gp47/JayE
MTKQELFEQIKLDFSNVYNIPVEDLGSNYIAESAVLATIEYSLLLRINEIAANIWVGSADAETLYAIGLDKIGRLPFPAVSGIYECTTTQIGTETDIIPLGTQFKKGAFVYETLTNINPGDNVQVRALTPGTISVLIVTDELTSVSPLPSIQDVIIVDSIIQTASDAEDIEDYRQDLINSYILRPSGGNAADYILWASDVSDIRTVYPYAADGEAGKINVYCEGVSSFEPIPAKIDEVIEAFKYDPEGNGRIIVDLFPFITDAYIVPVQISDINIVLSSGNTGQQAAAEQVIEDYLLGIRPYLPTLNQVRIPEDDTITQSGLIKVLSDNNITFSALVLKVKPLGGIEQTVTEYQVGDADDPTFYGEIPTLETLIINT